ncbi:MAG: flagellar export chaperone FliS [Chthonomonas sp.]|nr:flagellar export chaperone FliS [Chthonomonas sp.]
MANQRHLHAYQNTQVTSASPLQLVIMLYDGAIRFVKQGREAVVAGDTFNQNRCIQKAQRIVTELMSCLDMHRGGEVAQNLFALYSYAYNELVMGNIEDNPEMLDRAIKVLEDLRSSWVELDRQQRTGSIGELDAKPNAA